MAQVNSGQVKSGQVTSGQVKSGQVKLVQVKTKEFGQFKLGQFKLGRIKSGQAKSRQVKLGKVMLGQLRCQDRFCHNTSLRSGSTKPSQDWSVVRLGQVRTNYIRRVQVKIDQISCIKVMFCQCHKVEFNPNQAITLYFPPNLDQGTLLDLHGLKMDQIYQFF